MEAIRSNLIALIALARSCTCLMVFATQLNLSVYSKEQFMGAQRSSTGYRR